MMRPTVFIKPMAYARAPSAVLLSRSIYRAPWLLISALLCDQSRSGIRCCCLSMSMSIFSITTQMYAHLSYLVGFARNPRSRPAFHCKSVTVRILYWKGLRNHLVMSGKKKTTRTRHRTDVGICMQAKFLVVRSRRNKIENVKKKRNVTWVGQVRSVLS